VSDWELRTGSVAFCREKAEGEGRAAGAKRGGIGDWTEMRFTALRERDTFHKADADLYLPALLQGFTGSRKWMGVGIGGLVERRGAGAKVARPREEWEVGGGRPRMGGGDEWAEM